MLTTASIAQAMQGTSATNGWDAVFAMNLKQANALFFQEFLDAGPANPRSPTYLRCMLNDETSMWILDLQLGPPKLSLSGSASVTVEMDVISGVLVSVDPNTAQIVSASWLRPNESKLAGSLALATVRGEVNQLGAVVLDLGASTFAPTIAGVDPKSALSTEIGTAVQTFFRANAVTYTFGVIGNINVGTSLTPTSFQITTQQNATNTDSCVLVLIQTDGKPGTVGPLATYPIPDNAGVAVLIDQRPLFGALCDDLNTMFGPFGTRFSASNSSGGWASVGSGGQIGMSPVGKFSDCDQHFDPHAAPYTSDANNNLVGFSIALDGFTISGANGQLVANWSHQHAQHLSAVKYSSVRGQPGKCWVVAGVSTAQITLSASSSSPAVDSGSSKVSFNFSTPIVSVTPVDNQGFWGSLFASYSTAVNDAIQQTVYGTFKTFTVLSIDAFRLKCLLFQSADTVQLTGAALPNGVLLTGDAKKPIDVTPAATNVQPGGTVQFSAAGIAASNVMWELKPRGIGTISTAGLYTAPASIPSAQVVVVTAIDKTNTKNYGSAMVLVYQSPAAQGVAILPSTSLVTPGQHLRLSATDANSAPVTVTWALSPNTGTIKPGFKQGEYIYTAPAQISAATSVTATATNTANAQQTGSAVIQLTPVGNITVQATPTSAKLGATVALTANVTGDTDLRWVIYPTGAGTVAVSDDRSKATYTAPAAMPSTGNQATVFVYLMNGSAAATGSAAITLTS